MSDHQPYIPSTDLLKALQQGLGCCANVLPKIEYFEQLAATCPEIEPMVAELRIKYEHLDKMCRAGLGKYIQQG